MYGKYTNTQRRDSIERSFTWLLIEIPLAFRICVCVCLYLTVPETHVYRRRGGGGYLYRVVITWSTFQQFVCYVGMGGGGGDALFLGGCGREMGQSGVFCGRCAVGSGVWVSFGAPEELRALPGAPGAAQPGWLRGSAGTERSLCE